MSSVRRGWPAIAALVGLLLSAGPARADVTGPCNVTATATSTGPIDVGATAIWHLRSTDHISASGIATVPQTLGSGAAAFFGFEIPLISGTSDGETSVDVDLPDASLLAILGRVFVLSGSSAGPNGAAPQG